MSSIFKSPSEGCGGFVVLLDVTDRATAYDEIKKYDKAISDYNKAIKLDPNFEAPEADSWPGQQHPSDSGSLCHGSNPCEAALSERTTYANCTN
jgi:tetratricopeptide (TPR) repeat protein